MEVNSRISKEAINLLPRPCWQGDPVYLVRTPAAVRQAQARLFGLNNETGRHSRSGLDVCCN